MKYLFLTYLSLLSFYVFSQQSYYKDVDLTKKGIELKNELANKVISTHTRTLSYSEARDALKIIDLAPNYRSHVLLLYGYSNNTCEMNTNDDNYHRLRDKNSFGGGSTCEWNREHTFAKSLANPNLGKSGPGADVHHLRACDVQYNSKRGNKKFTDGAGNAGDVNNGWYPGDEWKGDVARMMMYMYLRYGNQCKPSLVGIGNSNQTPDDMIDLFLKWNAEDPVSEYEDLRNDYLENSNNRYGQGNRNPFIDNPYLATKIWGGISAENRWSTTASTKRYVRKNAVSLYPNPSSNGIIHITAPSGISINNIAVYSVLGKQVKKIDKTPINSRQLKIEHLKAGLYLIKIDNKNNQTIKKILIK